MSATPLLIFCMVVGISAAQQQLPTSDSRLQYSKEPSPATKSNQPKRVRSSGDRIEAASSASEREKLGPGVREAANSAESIRVFVILRDQPQSRIADDIRSIHDLRLQVAEGRYKDAAERALFATDGLDAPQRHFDEAVLTMRTHMLREIRDRITPQLDAVETRLRELGATNILRFNIITMLSATVPSSVLGEISTDNLVERIELVREAELLINRSVPATGVTTSFWANNFLGDNQWVAILDSGIRSNHPAFSNRLYYHPPTAVGPCSGGDSTANPDDYVGHGTHVAGIAAGGGSFLWSSYRGMAPNANILNVKVGCLGSPRIANDAIIQGIQSVAASNPPVQIVNLSIGNSQDVEDDVLSRAVDRAVDIYNLAVIVSAGNFGIQDPDSAYVASPAVSYNGLAVGNAMETSPGVFRSIYPGSSIGPTIDLRRAKPDLAAPGTNIYSANNLWDHEFDYRSDTGTSMAAPHVAGAAVLLRQRGVSDARAIKAILVNSSDFPPSGTWDPAAGWGFMNASRAYNQSTQRHFFVSTLTPSTGATPYRLYRGSSTPEVSATVVWNRYFDGSTPRVTDFDLSLYSQSNGATLGSSTSRVDNVEQVFRAQGGDFVVKVRSVSQLRATDSYAIAFNSANFQEAVGPRLNVTCTGPGTPVLNTDFEVSCTVANTGDLTAFSVQAALNYQGQTGGAVVSFGSIAPAGSATRSWTTRVTAAGTYNLVGTASSTSFGELFTGSGNLSVNVSGTVCVPTLSISTSNFSQQGGGATLTVNISPTCSWSLSSPSWLTFSQTSGIGATTLAVTVAPNAGSASRSATVTVNGASVSITQNGTGGNSGGSSAGLRFVPIQPCRLMETRTAYAGTTWTGAYGPPRMQAGQTRTLPIAGGARCGVPSHAKAFMLNVTADTMEENTGPIDIVSIYPSGTTRPAFGTIRTSTGGYIANAAIVQSGSNGAVDIYSSGNVHLLIDISGYFTDNSISPGLLFYPFGPCRAVDTRGAVYSQMAPPYGNSRLQSRETRRFRLPGSPGCPGLPAAAAYSLQMTLAPGAETNGTPVAYVTAWPDGAPQPIISNMNAFFGYAVSNSAVVPASANGSIALFTFDATNVILDVNGYFGPDDGSGRGLRFYAVTQCRAVDTQDATLPGAFGPPQLTPAADRVIAVPNSQRCQSLPATAQTWALNATAVPNGVGLPFLSMWPANAPWPVVSQLNAFQGQLVSNSGIVPAGSGGSIQVKVNATTHAIIEVAGYFAQ